MTVSWCSGQRSSSAHVNIVYDLHLRPNIPDTLQVGQNLRMTAEIVEFNDTNCLFLKPVSTEVR